MRIFDKDNIQMDGYDEKKGYLKKDSLFVRHHKAVEAVAEKGHWETVAEYPNGGKDVEWVVDAPGTEAKEAYDEYEEILRFIPYGEKELAQKQMDLLRQKLQNTDHQILKIVEGAANISEMAEVITQRAIWRKQIKELEDKCK